MAFLFDADDSSLGMWYGRTVMGHLLDTGVLQAVKRPMRVSVGDIVTYMKVVMSGGSFDDLLALNELVYVSKEPGFVFREKLQQVSSKGNVYCWLFQNITNEISKRMHERLANFSFYLGAMAVDFSYAPHLAFFRNFLVEKYRFSGCTVSEFFNLGNNEGPDISTKEEFESRGFSVLYEDIGGRRTIFDNYDSIGHFRRVADFRRVFSDINGLTEDDASSITFSLEELHPKLFDVFAAAARALQSAETDEDFAQAALSGRRLLEKLADYLYPPRVKPVKGRSVGTAQYKNRLWAYIDQTISDLGPPDENLKTKLGNEADRLIGLFNGGLHSDATRQQLEGGFRDLVIWLSNLIELSPAHVRKPYLAYSDEVERYAEEMRINLKDD